MSVSFVVGVVLGLVAGFGRRLVDIVIMRRDGPHLAVPSLVLAILVVAVLGPEPRQHHRRGDDRRICRATSGWCAPRRSASSTKDYVTAARVAGVGPLRLMFVDRAAQLPRAADRAGGARRLRRHSRSGGASASSASAPSRRRRNGARCWPTRASSSAPTPGSWRCPASPSSITVLAINLIGDGLRDALDPRMRRS